MPSSCFMILMAGLSTSGFLMLRTYFFQTLCMPLNSGVSWMVPTMGLLTLISAPMRPTSWSRRASYPLAAFLL